MSDAEIAAYERQLAADPARPNSWFNLAMRYRAARRPHDALAAYARALEHGVSGPEEVHLKRGVIFADDLGDSEAAAEELAAALLLNPDYVPALLNLGNLHEDLGERGPAWRAYARAAALAPGDALVLARLAGVSDLDGPGDPLLGQLRAALAGARTPLDRADLGFALAAALDRLGAYDEAAAAGTAANRAAREMARTAGLTYDRAAQSARIDATIAAWPAGPRATPPPDPASPIFICGMFRSGSTLAEALLARHPQVVAGGELDLIPAFAARVGSGAAQATPAAVAALRAEYLAATGQRHPPGTRLTDKRPDNFLHVGLIKTLFPAARIVHTVREPRDNALSVWFLHAAASLAYATDLGDIFHYRREQERLMAHWQAVYPGDIFTLDYDRLVADPGPLLAALLEFCGLAPVALLDCPPAAAAVRTASNWQVRRPLYRDASGRWRNYAAHLDFAEPSV